MRRKAPMIGTTWTKSGLDALDRHVASISRRGYDHKSPIAIFKLRLVRHVHPPDAVLR